MKRGLPLSARILLWALLNLVLLAALGWTLVRGQFGLGLDALLAGRAGDRLQGMADVLAGELSRTPQADWDEVLARNAEAYQLQLSVVRPDGEHWAGAALALPPEVKQRLGGGPPGENPPPLKDRFSGDFRRALETRREGGAPVDFPNRDLPRGSGRRAPGPDENFPPPEPLSPAPAGTPPDQSQERGPGLNRSGLGWDFRRALLARQPGRPRFLVRAGDPAQYWAGLNLTGLTAPGGRPAPAMLLAVASSLTAGGWVVDPLPWLLGGFGAVLLSILLWYPLVRGVTRSIRETTAATERLAEGKFGTAVNVVRSDELGRLGTAVNHLSGRLEHFVNGQRRFLGDIAHELCGPLARMQLGATLMEREASEAQKERVGDVREEVELMTGLVNELLTFSKAGLRSPDAALEPVKLADLARQAAAREAGPSGGVEIEIPETLAAMAAPDLLARAIANLVRNALRYAGQAGPVRLHAGTESGQIFLTVSDQGPGVPEAELERIFEPFYRPDTARTREAGGTGLGLAIVRTCVDACQGTVSARNREPSGLEVTIRLNGPEPR